jgi:hypothetical protein
LDYNTYPNTLDWINGFRSSNAGRSWKLYNAGDAAGCQKSSSTNSCNNGWNKADIWNVSQGNTSHGGAIPQIYANYYGSNLTSDNAKSWKGIADYAINNGLPKLEFAGSLSQWSKCQQLFEENLGIGEPGATIQSRIRKYECYFTIPDNPNTPADESDPATPTTNPPTPSVKLAPSLSWRSLLEELNSGATAPNLTIEMRWSTDVRSLRSGAPRNQVTSR